MIRADFMRYLNRTPLWVQFPIGGPMIFLAYAIGEPLSTSNALYYDKKMRRINYLSGFLSSL